MAKKYEIIEHTADVGLKVFGKTRVELFQNAALGMFFLITGCSRIMKQGITKKNYKVECKAADLEDLLVSWLSDLLYIHNTEYVILDDFVVKKLTEYNILAESKGIKIREFNVQIKNEIKAVTYHGLKVFRSKSGKWKATLIFDI